MDLVVKDLPFTAGSSNSHLDVWRRMIPHLSREVENWLRFGVFISPTWSVTPFHKQPRVNIPEEQHTFIGTQIEKDLTSGAIVPCHYPPTCSSRVFAVPKQGAAKFRLVVDLRSVNESFPDLPARYDHLGKLADLAELGDWFFAIDLKQAYQQIAVHPTVSQYFGIQWNGQFFKYTVLFSDGLAHRMCGLQSCTRW